MAGSITKIPNKNAGGLVGTAFGTCHISHCRSSVEIVCASGDHSSGGFIGELGTSSDPDDTYIDNCLFDGILQGLSSHSWGGFIGWVEDEPDAYISNCLFKPAQVTVTSDGNKTFARGSDIHISNCYYTQSLGTVQGKQAYSITCANNDITLNFAGAATENEVSGITSYANNHGFLYNDGTGSTLIAGNGDNVSLKLMAPAGYFINSTTYTPAGDTATEMAFANGGYSPLPCPTQMWSLMPT